MKAFGERLLSVAAALVVLSLFLVPSATAQSQSLEVAGLEAENVNTSFRSDEIRFTTSYMNQSLSPREVFVPKVLEDDLDSFTYSLQSFNGSEWPGVEAQLYLQIQYGGRYSSDYPTAELSTVLGNNDTDTGNLTPHQYIYSNYDYVKENNNTGSVFDMSLEDGPTRFDINVKAHYEHLVIEYQVLQNRTRTVNETVNGTNVTTTENVSKVVWETRDVYSGEEPELTPIDARADSNTIAENPTQSLSVEYDNRYDDRKNITFIAAVPENASLLRFRSNAEKVVKQNSSFYSEVRSRIIENNLSDRYLLNNSSRYRFQAFNLTVPRDSTVSARLKASLEESGQELYGYILGSTGATLTTTELENSTITDYNRYKGLNVTSASGTPSIDKAQPVYLTCGDDSTTGTGDIVINCSNVDGVEDIAFYDTNGDLLNYEVESFNLDTGGEAVAWVYNTWTRDGDVGGYIGFGDGPSDRQDITGTWSGTNALFVVHDPSKADESTGSASPTITGSVSSTTGQFDGAALFDGTEGYTDLNRDYDLNPITIVAWHQTTTTDFSPIVDTYDGSQGAFRLYKEDGGAGDDMAFQVGSGASNRIDTDTSISDGVMRRFVGRWQNQNIDLWYDDSQVASGTTDPTPPDNPSDYWIGRRNDGAIQADGTIDEVRLYSDYKPANWLNADFDASGKAGKVFFDQNAAQEVETNQPPQVGEPVVRPSSVKTGASIEVSVNVSDPNSSIEAVNISLVDPTGNVEVDKAGMTNETAVASEYYYSFTVPEESSDVGEWTATVYATDNESTTGSNSTTFTVSDGILPHWFNFTDNATNSGWITGTEGTSFSVQGQDNESGVRKITLATNETGQWRNWTPNIHKTENPGNATGGENPENVKYSDNNYADLGGSCFTCGIQELNASDFNFTIPSEAEITGVKAEIERYSSAEDGIDDKNINLIVNGNETGENKAKEVNWPTSDATAVYGGPHDLWNTSLNVSDVNSGDLGISVFPEIINSNDAANPYIDHINLTVYYERDTTKYFDNVTGSKVEARFNWSNPDFTGTLGAKAYIVDGKGNTNVTTVQTVDVDSQPPQFFNYTADESEVLLKGDPLNISAELRDNESGLSKAYLATNETGQWKNYSSTYDFNIPALTDSDLEVSYADYDAANLSLTNINGFEKDLGRDMSSYTIGGMGDFDQDGVNEIAIENPDFRVIDIENRSLDLSPAASDIGGMGDIDSDGLPEVAYRTTTSSDCQLKAVDHEGEITDVGVNFQVQLYSCVGSLGGVGDIDGDGDEEIAYRNSSNDLNVVGAEGNVTKLTGGAYEIGGVGDLDEDGEDEVAYEGANYILSFVGIDQKVVETGAEVSDTSNAPIGGVGDIDGDGELEIAFEDTSLLYVDAEGQVNSLQTSPDSQSNYVTRMGLGVGRMNIPPDSISGERLSGHSIWQNESFEGNLAYKIWAKDAKGNWKSTEVRTIEVQGTITENLSDSANITGSTSSFGDFFGEASTSFDLTEAINTVVSENVFLQSVVNATGSTVEDVEVSEVISSPVTLSLELVSFTSAEDRQDTNVDVDDSTQGQGEVSDTASATFNPSAEVEVLGVNASSVLETVIDLNLSKESQGLVTDTLSTTVTALTQAFSETAVNSTISDIVDILGTTDSQASANGTVSTNIPVNEITSSTATTTLELFTPLTVTTTAKGQGTATSQVSTDIGFSTDLASQVTGTGVVSTVIDVTEICWAGSPCYQDITGNQTEQPSGGTGVIDGEGPLTIIKPVPIPAKSVPEWMQIYYQQHRNKIHGFALFLIAATGFLTLRKIIGFIL